MCIAGKILSATKAAYYQCNSFFMYGKRDTVTKAAYYKCNSFFMYGKRDTVSGLLSMQQLLYVW